jgi:hypothetical protein
MKVAVGFKAHSGWAALVAVGVLKHEPVLIERSRIELVAAGDADWAKQPYHAAEKLLASAARALVERGIKAAKAAAAAELRAFSKRMREANHEIAGCAIVVGKPMPGWSVEQILSVHVRMHQAEGVLFPNALLEAATACQLNVTSIPESELPQMSAALTALGKAAGPPWGKDQKSAALAAWLTLRS